MRANYSQGTSTTGGTGTLTITSDSGCVLPYAAIGVADALVEYSIVEYTDSTRATISQSEAGYGRVSSGNVLTRSIPISTNSSGTPDITAPSALNFGTSNVVVSITPLATSGDWTWPKLYDTSAESNGFQAYVMPSNCLAAFDHTARALSANTLYMVPILLAGGCRYTSFGVEVTTASSGNSASCFIADFSTGNGGPGNILQVANSLSMTSTGFVTASIDWTPPPGWYWFGVVSNSTPTLRACEFFVPGPLGIINSRTGRGVDRSMTYGTFTAGASGQASLTGSWNTVVNNSYPIPFLR